MSTKNRPKKITEADRCVIAQTHQRNYICKLVSFMNDEPIVNQRLLCCYKCYSKLRKMHAVEVGPGRFHSTFEHFKDIYLENSLISAKSVINCGHNDEDTIREFGKKLQEFQEHVAKKIYCISSVKEIEKLPNFSSQKFPIQDVMDMRELI